MRMLGMMGNGCERGCPSEIRWRSRQLDGERASPAFFAVDMHRPAVRSDNVPHEGEAQTRAFDA